MMDRTGMELGLLSVTTTAVHGSRDTQEAIRPSRHAGG